MIYTKAANRKRMSEGAAKLITETGIGKPLTRVAKTASKSLKTKRVKS
jgi:hypothetical protein